MCLQPQPNSKTYQLELDHRDDAKHRRGLTSAWTATLMWAGVSEW